MRGKWMIHAAAVPLLIGLLWLMWRFDVPCPVRALLRVPCPACGVTRALAALLRLDVGASLTYHPLALPLCAAALLALHRPLFRRTRAVDCFVIAVAVAVLALYVARLFCGTIPA